MLWKALPHWFIRSSIGNSRPYSGINTPPLPPPIPQMGEALNIRRAANQYHSRCSFVPVGSSFEKIVSILAQYSGGATAITRIAAKANTPMASLFFLLVRAQYRAIAARPRNPPREKVNTMVINIAPIPTPQQTRLQVVRALRKRTHAQGHA